MFGLSLPTSAAIGALLAFTAGAAIGARVDHAFEQAVIEKMVANEATARAAAITAALQRQQQVDKAAADADVAEAKAQVQIVTQTRTITKEVPRYVTVAQDSVRCVTYGLVRVHDAAALGVDPSTLPLPAGKSDDDCSPVASSALAEAISDNYGAARQNAEQLDALNLLLKAQGSTAKN